MKSTGQPVDRQMAAASYASSIMPGSKYLVAVTDISVDQAIGKVTVTYDCNPFTGKPGPYTYTFFTPDDVARFHIPTLAGASEKEYATRMLSDPQRTLWELAQRAVSKGTVKIGRLSVGNGLSTEETGVMGVYRPRDEKTQDLLAFMPVAPHHFASAR